MTIRAATEADIPALQILIAEAGIALSRGFYSDAQAAAITRQVYGVDSRLIADGTYFVVEDSGTFVACGGWSRRGTLFGSDHAKQSQGGADPLLDPATDAARIRAFFVAPGHARRGLASALMQRGAAEAWFAGFRRMTLVSTMPGEPLYAAFGFVVDDRFELPIDDQRVPLANMSRPLDGPSLQKTT